MDIAVVILSTFKYEKPEEYPPRKIDNQIIFAHIKKPRLYRALN
jgi:hypothetical protein